MKKTTTKSKATKTTKTAKKKPTNKATKASTTVNPYREGSTYALIFKEGTKGYYDAKAFAEKVAKLGKVKPQAIIYGLAVLGSPNHKSNGGRSEMVITEINGKKQRKLVAFKK